MGSGGFNRPCIFNITFWKLLAFSVEVFLAGKAARFTYPYCCSRHL